MSASATNSTGVQWYKDGVAIPSATSPTYSKPNVALEDAGEYHATFQINGNPVETTKATVTVIPAVPKVETVSLSGAKKRYVKKGAQLAVDVTVTPDDANQAIVAESGDDAVLTVETA